MRFYPTAMARVWCALVRWSLRGLRLRTTGILALTFLVMLTTNLYLVNRTVLDENGQLNLYDRRRSAVDDDDGDDINSGDNSEENILMNKMKSLKDELWKARTRINAQKELVGKKMTQLERDLEDKPLENKLKRHLMNAVGLDKSFVTMVTTSDQQRRLENAETRAAFLYQENVSIKLNSSFLSCQDLPQNPDVLENIGSGYTKQVMKADVNGIDVALKQANRGGRDGKECVQYGMTEEDCYRLANYKVLKELALLQQLKSPHIIKLLGYCLQDEEKEDETASVTIATEFGEPLTFIMLLQMSWEDRLRIAFGITTLLVYLHDSPMGALTIHDFKLAQFVLVKNEIKLADLDDVDDNKPTCSQADDCRRGAMSHQPCVDGICPQFSDRLNVYHAHKLFYSLLPFEAPASVQKMIAELTNNTGQASWSSDTILQQLGQILHRYQNSKIYDNIGGASHIPDDKFNQFRNRDFPAVHDYWCHGTIYAGANSCAFSVLDEKEAKYLCSLDPQCKAFVMTTQKTWTGRTVVYLKNKTSESVPSKGNTLFIRVT